MSKTKQNKNFSKMTLPEAVAWAEKNTEFADARNRMASRQVAHLLLNALKEGANYVQQLENLISTQEKLIQSYEAKLKVTKNG